MQAKCKGVRTRRLLPGLGNPGRLPGRSGKFRSLKSDLQGVAWIVVEQGAVRSSRERNVGVEDWRVGATQSSGLRGRAKVQLGSEGRGRLHWRMYSEMPCDQLGVEARTGGRAMTQAAEPREPKYSFRTLPLHGRAEGKAWPSRTLSLPDSHTHSHTHTHACMHVQTHSDPHRLTEEPVPLSSSHPPLPLP